MSSPPQFSEREIQAHIDGQSFQRGRSYANNGRIIHPRRQGDTLKAFCIGSRPEPYQLSATIAADGGIRAECSCPVGYGGHCKHVAALLLTWMTAPEQFIEVEDLAQTLGRKTREELVDLLLGIAASNPQVELLLETAAGGEPEAGTPGADFYRQQAASMIGPDPDEYGSYGGYGYGYGLAGNLPTIVGQGDAMAGRGEWRAAAAIYRGVLEGVMESEAALYDEEGGLTDVAAHCIDGLGNCLAQMSDPAERTPLLDTLFESFCHDIDEFGGIGLADGVPGILVERTTREEREEIIGWVEGVLPPGESWSRGVYADLLFDLQAGQLDDESYIAQCRELGMTDRLVERLLSLGRNDEALAAVTEVDAAMLGIVLPIFVRHRQDNLIEPLVARQFVTDRPVEPFGVQMQFANWLKSRYTARGDQAAALPIAVRMFKSSPQMAGYREVRELARATGEWLALRSDLLAWMAGRVPSLKVEAHLDEGELDEAIAAVRRFDIDSAHYYYGHDVQLQVAEAAAVERPEAALEIYLQRADKLIDLRGRENYQTAATLLSRARELYERLGRREAWDSHITRLRGEHTRLWALREELDRAGL